MSTTDNNWHIISKKTDLRSSKPVYLHNSVLAKVERKIRNLVLKKVAGTFLQFKIYRSYWHYKVNGILKVTPLVRDNSHYICLKPNYGAGIGHQLANWNAGLYFAGCFKLKFAHFPFSDQKWEQFLGFGENQVAASALLKNKNFRKVKLPRFDSNDKRQIELINDIINSYSHPQILFFLEQDQGYMRQFETYRTLSQFFFDSALRVNDKLLFNKDTFNIAIHIRRGDIVEMKNQNESNWKDRWLDDSYYVNVLKRVLLIIKIARPIKIFLFSQGTHASFRQFDQFDNIEFMLNMGPIESFLNMVYADILISSKSSFSYKPALISKGIKICPKTFWHEYPETSDFILADNKGDFDADKLSVLIKRKNSDVDINEMP